MAKNQVLPYSAVLDIALPGGEYVGDIPDPVDRGIARREAELRKQERIDELRAKGQ